MRRNSLGGARAAAGFGAGGGSSGSISSGASSRASSPAGGRRRASFSDALHDARHQRTNSGRLEAFRQVQLLEEFRQRQQFDEAPENAPIRPPSRQPRSHASRKRKAGSPVRQNDHGPASKRARKAAAAAAAAVAADDDDDDDDGDDGFAMVGASSNKETTAQLIAAATEGALRAVFAREKETVAAAGGAGVSGAAGAGAGAAGAGAASGSGERKSVFDAMRHPPSPEDIDEEIWLPRLGSDAAKTGLLIPAWFHKGGMRHDRDAFAFVPGMELGRLKDERRPYIWRPFVALRGEGFQASYNASDAIYSDPFVTIRDCQNLLTMKDAVSLEGHAIVSAECIRIALGPSGKLPRRDEVPNTIDALAAFFDSNAELCGWYAREATHIIPWVVFMRIVEDCMERWLDDKHKKYIVDQVWDYEREKQKKRDAITAAFWDSDDAASVATSVAKPQKPKQVPPVPLFVPTPQLPYQPILSMDESEAASFAASEAGERDERKDAASAADPGDKKQQQQQQQVDAKQEETKGDEKKETPLHMRIGQDIRDKTDNAFLAKLAAIYALNLRVLAYRGRQDVIRKRQAAKRRKEAEQRRKTAGQTGAEIEQKDDEVENGSEESTTSIVTILCNDTDFLMRRPVVPPEVVVVVNAGGAAGGQQRHRLREVYYHTRYRCYVDVTTDGVIPRENGKKVFSLRDLSGIWNAEQIRDDRYLDSLGLAEFREWRRFGQPDAPSPFAAAAHGSASGFFSSGGAGSAGGAGASGAGSGGAGSGAGSGSGGAGSDRQLPWQQFGGGSVTPQRARMIAVSMDPKQKRPSGKLAVVDLFPDAHILLGMYSCQMPLQFASATGGWQAMMQKHVFIHRTRRASELIATAGDDDGQDDVDMTRGTTPFESLVLGCNVREVHVVPILVDLDALCVAIIACRVVYLWDPRSWPTIKMKLLFAGSLRALEKSGFTVVEPAWKPLFGDPKKNAGLEMAAVAWFVQRWLDHIADALPDIATRAIALAPGVKLDAKAVDAMDPFARVAVKPSDRAYVLPCSVAMPPVERKRRSVDEFLLAAALHQQQQQQQEQLQQWQQVWPLALVKVDTNDESKQTTKDAKTNIVVLATLHTNLMNFMFAHDVDRLTVLKSIRPFDAVVRPRV